MIDAKSSAFAAGNRPGLTQRDYVAIEAMKSMLKNLQVHINDIPKQAYKLTDEMIEASKKGSN